MKEKTGPVQSNLCTDSVFSFQQLFTYLYYSNLIVGLTTAIASLLPLMISNRSFSPKCFFFILASTTFIYNFDRKSPCENDRENVPLRSHWLAQHQNFINTVNILCFSLCCWSFFSEVTFYKSLAVLGLLLICLSYCGIKKFKQIPGIKNFTIALTWSFTVVFLPLIWLTLEINLSITLIFVGSFLTAFINSLLFDLRDLHGDRKRKIRSLPALIGTPQTHLLMIVLVMSLAAISIFDKCLYGFAASAVIFYYFKNKDDKISKEIFIELALCLPALSFIVLKTINFI